METITSRENAKIKYAARCATQKSSAPPTGFSLPRGRSSAWSWPKAARRVRCTPRRRRWAKTPELAQFDPAEIAPHVAEKLSGTKSNQGVFALFETPVPPADTLDTARRILMLEGVQDPGNVGTLLRSAAAFGFDAVVLGPGCASPLSPKTLRSSMGAAGRLPTLHSDDLPAARPRCVPRRDDAGDGALPLPSAGRGRERFPGRAVRRHRQARGRASRTGPVEACDMAVRIPMTDRVESLNAAVAGSVLLWHFRGV